MEVQAEEQAAEAQKERKLRERNEQYSRQLEEDLEGLKVRKRPRSLRASVSDSTPSRPGHSVLSWTPSPIFLPASLPPLPHQVKQAGSSAGPASADQSQEVGRLRGDLEKKTLLYEEELARREAQHATELKAARKELRDAEGQQLTLQKEILMLKDKLDKTRRERCSCLCLHPIRCFCLLYSRSRGVRYHDDISVSLLSLQ